MSVFQFKYWIIVLFSFGVGTIFSQNLEFKLYSKTLRLIEEKNYKGALKTMDQYFRYFSDSPRMAEVFCNRAIVHIELHETNAAIDDYVNAIQRDSLNAELYKLRGGLLLQLERYNSAMKDFDHALRLDSSLGECFAAKAKIYQAQGSGDMVCKAYYQALRHGYSEALQNIMASCDTSNIVISRYLLKVLDVRSTDSDYGYSEFKPIKVGGNKLERLEQYLSLLRDKNGLPIAFKHLNNCCPYKSNYGAFGKGLCDTYEISIYDERRVLYLSLYDYEEPRVPVGLYSTYHFRE
ncbi:MAG: hypothetical protein WCR21_11910 [Bacteroidota bacterium]